MFLIESALSGKNNIDICINLLLSYDFNSDIIWGNAIKSFENYNNLLDKRIYYSNFIMKHFH